jgi:hypothetical protein
MDLTRRDRCQTRQRKLGRAARHFRSWAAEIFLRQLDGKWLHKGLDHGERALAAFLDNYRALLDTQETRFEKATDIDVLYAVIDSLIPLARSTANTKLALQSAREALANDAFIITMRDRSVDIARGFELLLADARLALEYRVARSAEEQIRAAEIGNRAQQKLNILAAIAFPIMTVSAVFGTNLRSGLENMPILAFWLVFAGGLALGLFVRRWVSEIGPPTQSSKALSPAKKR